eukprot:CAMPEP_0119298256 /NCGR_PEP_ID=MMETSP1333-20130426/463_1 /TAXON_ID=418940 /ORGANISM="Scyphosphaera apsteinii, Strain RCC1455" /LENGTH=72 /DNA_ID=CAMNT_0007299313 /DNA_START=424 /DNA_END=639 /DNA_ORIENTATION=-
MTTEKICLHGVTGAVDWMLLRVDGTAVGPPKMPPSMDDSPARKGRVRAVSAGAWDSTANISNQLLREKEKRG